MTGDEAKDFSSAVSEAVSRGLEIGLKNQRDPGYSWRGLGT